MSSEGDEIYPPITKLTFKSQFLKIEITDPNILDELNTPRKYPKNLPFKRLEININRLGGRYYLKTHDRNEINKEVYSGISKNECQEIPSFITTRSDEQSQETVKSPEIQ